MGYLARRYPIWSVTLEAQVVRIGTPIREAFIEQFLDELRTFSPAVSYTPTGLSISLTLCAPKIEQAVAIASDSFTRAVKAIGPPKTTIVHAEATLDSIDYTPTYPPLMGIAEIANFLSVSRSRASELAQSAAFPSPLLTLAAGPFWLQSSVHAFQSTWERRSGRPPKSPATS